jgi:RNA polymerase sigma-70 factor (ECF subfamily)
VPTNLTPTYFADLLRLVAKKNASAHDELYRLSRPQLAAYARRILPNEAFLEDVLQDTLIAIWLSAGNYISARAAPMTWMITILRNKAFDSYRATAQSCRWEHEWPEGTVQWHSESLEPDFVLEQSQQSRALARSMSKLNNSQRAALELSYFHDLSGVEVAATMKVSVGTAKTWIRRGRINLRKSYLEV